MAHPFPAKFRGSFLVPYEILLQSGLRISGGVASSVAMRLWRGRGEGDYRAGDEKEIVGPLTKDNRRKNPTLWVAFFQKKSQNRGPGFPGKLEAKHIIR